MRKMTVSAYLSWNSGVSCIARAGVQARLSQSLVEATRCQQQLASRLEV